MKLKNPWAVLIVIFAVLAAVALYKSELAYRHGEVMAGFIMLVIAAIFLKRVMGRS